MEYHLVYIILAVVLGLWVTWSVGANDLANVMSTTIGSKAITVRQAIIIAVIFECAGALLGGSGVAATVRSGIINTQLLSHDTNILILGMLAVLAAGATWLTVASFMGMPVSITQAIVGSIFGFGLIVLGPGAIHWQQIIYILISWVASPSVAGVLAYLLFMSVQNSIFSTKTPLLNAKRIIPFYLFLVGFILSAITVLKALTHFGIELSLLSKLLIALLSGGIVLIIGKLALRRTKAEIHFTYKAQFTTIEQMFGILMIFTACAMVFAHGSNDVAIAVGPVAEVINLVYGNQLPANANLIMMVLFFGCLSVVAGFLMYGRKVIITVGSGITALTPSRAFSATLAAATTVVVSTTIGIPVSATQTLVGAVLGVGLARGIGALDLGVIRNIFFSWIITLPVSSSLTIAFFYLLLKLQLL